MAVFRFELAAVLEQRRAVERTKQVAVGAIERQRLEIEERIRSIQAQIVEEKEDLRRALTAENRPGTPVDLRYVRLQAGASLRMVGEAQRAVSQLVGVHKRLDAARLELVGATTRRKAVEVLRERRFEQWRAEQDRRENAAIDELSVMHAGRLQEAVP